MTKASGTREEEGGRYYAYFREELFSRLGGEQTEARRATTTWQATGTPQQRGEYRWNVKERDGGGWWIVGEPDDPLEIVGPDGRDLRVGFHLPPSVTRDGAQKVADFLNDWIAQIVLF
jgi:alkanesulfonate monooxygenase SsuD/methylene tetrahydromethanopterin reductase-like flavin-dependent oxidoreductase (luciferase family)